MTSRNHRGGNLDRQQWTVWVVFVNSEVWTDGIDIEKSCEPTND